MKSYLKRFLNMLRPQLKRALWATLLMLIIVLLQLPLPLFSKFFIDNILPQKSFYLLNVSIIILIIVFIIREGASVLNEYLLAIFREMVIYAMRLKLFQHVQNLNLSFFRKHQTGYVVSRIYNDTGNLHGLLADAASNFLKDSLTLSVGIVAITIFSWKLAAASLSVLPLFIYSILFFSPRIKSRSREVQEKIARTSGILQESLTGIYLIKSFLIEKFESRKLSQRMKELLKSRLSLSLLKSISTHSIALLGSFSSIILLWYGGYMVFHNEITLGVLMASTTLLSYIFGPTHRLINLNADLQTSLACLERIYELFDMPSESIDEKPGKKIRCFKGKVTFKNVTFSYDGKEKTLQDINLTVEQGETIALVGKSGAGKTTICNLLLRFYEPQDGEITIDEINIMDIRLKDLRMRIGIVPQEGFLFSGSLKDNIAIGRLNANDEEITNAAKLAQLHDFIESLPEGYGTQIGERGAKLSGGERQRLSISRIFLKSPEIVILDEATSELDRSTEMLVNTAIDNLIKDRTTFIIAHRLSTIVSADKIFVIESGKIIGAGRHNDLYEGCKAYRELYDLQFTQ